MNDVTKSYSFDEIVDNVTNGKFNRTLQSSRSDFMKRGKINGFTTVIKTDTPKHAFVPWFHSHFTTPEDASQSKLQKGYL